MTRKNISTLAIALSALFAGQAIAADVNAAPLTRAQVKAELAEAVRTGQVFDAASDTQLNQAYPQNYSNSQAAEQVTRADVQAELAQAQQNGYIFDTATDSYVDHPTRSFHGAGKTRAQVKAELAEAVRSGNIFNPASDRLLKNS